MSDKPIVQTSEQRDQIRAMAQHCEGISDRLAAHDIALSVVHQRNVGQSDGTTADTLALTQSLQCAAALYEMLADWQDAKKAAQAEGRMDPFVSKVLELQGGEAN